MHDVATTRVRSTTTLSFEQRERFRREGRIARAVEAAQRRSDGRLSSTAVESKAPSDRDGQRRPRGN
jgi:hypothetical protein